MGKPAPALTSVRVSIRSVRQAEYSSSDTYSKPDSQGVKRMLACRVAVGCAAMGENNAIAPPARDGDLLLYDSTVNDVANPTIFVTYHDSQAYPEYLVCFRRFPRLNVV